MRAWTTAWVLAGVTACVWASVGVAPAFADCSQADRNAGECRSIDASTGEGDVTIRVDTSSPGTPGSRGGGGSGDSSPPEAAPPAPPTPAVPPGRTSPPPPRDPVLGTSECQVTIGGRCRASSPPKNSPPPPSEASVRPVTQTPPTPPRSASDIGSFRPETPGMTVQPGWWSMPRLPTNFVAHARTHTRSGELAGWPVEVRFIPHRYHWSFGDGGRASWREPGRTWSGWGLNQFDPTPTSHVYSRPGNYTVSVSVEYRVEFRFVGQSFQRLSGTVSATAGSTRVQVLTVSPLLVG